MKYEKGGKIKVNIPPFVKTYVSVIIHVDLVEESIQATIRHGYASRLEGSSELLFAQLAIMVPIDRLEEKEELPLGSLDKNSEL